MSSFGWRGVASLLTWFLLTFKPAAAQGQYSLQADWSDANNPNGAWSYNHNDAPITVHQSFWWGQGGWGYLELGDGAIFKGPPTSGLTDPFGNVVPPAHDWESNDVILHALSIPYGGDTTFLNVRWTSPGSGQINILGRVWDAQIYADREVSWTLSLDGEIYAQRAAVRGLYRTNLEAQLESNLVGHHVLTDLPVRKDDVVELRVAAQTYYGHFAGVDLQVVPQPGFVANPLLSAAAMSLLTFSNLTVARTYQLQQAVAWYWSNQPVSFTAASDVYTQLVGGIAASGDYRLVPTPAPSQAFAAAQVVNGFVVGATIISGGSGYLTNPAVTIVVGGGSNATALATAASGAVTAIHITDAGIGYTNTPIIRIDPPPAGAVPAASVLPLLQIHANGLIPGHRYQIQFQASPDAPWQDRPDGLFNAAAQQFLQYVPMTNGVGFFRVEALP